MHLFALIASNYPEEALYFWEAIIPGNNNDFYISAKLSRA